MLLEQQPKTNTETDVITIIATDEAAEKNSLANIERFVQRIRMTAH